METSGMLAGIVCRDMEPGLWPQLETPFGKNGACGGCWCWYWRLAGVERSPRFKGRPAEDVWFVGCFFIQRSWRRRGLAELLLGKAIEVMEREGARAVEAVPTATHGRPQADAFLFTGTYEMFERLGFHTTMDARGKTTIMRREFIPGCLLYTSPSP